MKNTSQQSTSSSKEFELMVTELMADIRACERRHNEEDTQFWRRSYIRSVFAFFEAATFRAKMEALEKGAQFPVGMISILKEQSIEVNEKGELYSQPKFIELTRNVR